MKDIVENNAAVQYDGLSDGSGSDEPQAKRRGMRNIFFVL